MRHVAPVLAGLACMGSAWQQPGVTQQAKRDALATEGWQAHEHVAAVARPPLLSRTSRGASGKDVGRATSKLALLVLALCPAAAFKPANSGGSIAPEYTLRLATRRDLLPVSALVEGAFAGESRYGDTDNATLAKKGSKRSWLNVQTTRFRVALDVEQRMTPWNWSRHAQVVAEEVGTGSILGFAEVWGEDTLSLNNQNATNPQPMLHNLCVSDKARRRGVGSRLIAMCEDQVRSWGEYNLYIKVRDDNVAACTMYESQGFELLDIKPAGELTMWRDLWKGGSMPLRLMQKSLTTESSGTPAKSAPPREYWIDLNLKSVLAYKDPDALVWFALFVLRNIESLSPEYGEAALRIVRDFSAIIGWVVILYLAAHPSLVKTLLPMR